jgi:hypothetical protein
MSKYQIIANDFIIRTGVTFEAKFLKNDFYFADDKTTRDVYEITLAKSEDRRMVFKFAQSLNDSTVFESQDNYSRAINAEKIIIRRGKAPTAYEVLACLTKYNVGSFEDFCSEYGYNIDSKNAERIYLACKEEFEGIQKLWSDSEIEELREID